MNNKNPQDPNIKQFAVAVTQEQGRLNAVLLCRKNGVLELVRTAKEDPDKMSLRNIVAEVTKQSENETDIKTVTGYGNTGVIFYNIKIPRVNEDKLAGLIRLQAEAKMPLPLEQMGFAWQIRKSNEKQLTVTIAAARKKQLQDFVSNVEIFKPDKIFLDHEGIVKAWKEFFDGEKQDCLILDITENNTKVCLTENLHLSNAASLDIGTNDLLTGNSEITDRFAQDIKNILEMFGLNDLAEPAICVLSNGRSEINQIVSSLNSAGFNAKAVLPDFNSSYKTEDIYEYRTAAGLAAMALEADGKDIDIFKDIYSPKSGKTNRIRSTKNTAIIAAVTFILLIIVCYLMDKASLKVTERYFNSSNCEMLVTRQKLIKQAARTRPDLLKLLDQINSDENNGVLLNSFHFKKGRPVTITGQVANDEQLYKFQESLLKKKGISRVIIQRARKKEKNLNFTITFHYRNFTKKR